MEPARSSTSHRRVVVLLSGSGTLFQALLDARREGWSIAGVVSDRADAYGLRRARTAGVPTAVVDPADFPDRVAWDVAVAKAVGVFSPDLVVLAGFMRILGEPFLAAFGGRTVNTHPALLPSFPGAHGVRDALAYGVKVTGSTVIIVDAGVDTGPDRRPASGPGRGRRRRGEPARADQGGRAGTARRGRRPITHRGVARGGPAGPDRVADVSDVRIPIRRALVSVYDKTGLEESREGAARTLASPSSPPARRRAGSPRPGFR